MAVDLDVGYEGVKFNSVCFQFFQSQENFFYPMDNNNNNNNNNNSLLFRAQKSVQ